MRCDTSYIPIWPIFYYKESMSKNRLHILWPLITYLRTNTATTFAILYIFFRWTVKNSKSYFDIFWPIIHLEVDEDTGGFHFGIRPLLWIIVEPNKTHISILGFIQFRYAKDGDDIWFVLAPLIWYRVKRSKSVFIILPILWVFNDSDKCRIFLIPLGNLTLKGSDGWSLNLLLLFNIISGKKYFTIFLIPAFFVRVSDSSVTVNLMAIIHIHVGDSSFYWMILPLIYHFKSTLRTRFLIVPFFTYTRYSSTFNVNMLGLYHFRKSSETTFHMLALIFFYLRTSDFTFLNIAILFNYIRKSSGVKWIVLFPTLWIKSIPGKSFMFHLWPMFGWKISQKSRGFNIYFLYPGIIYKNKKNGQFKLLNILFPLIHFYWDTELKESRKCILPLFFYSNMDGISKGFVLLYFWYSRLHRYKIKESKNIQQMVIGSPDNNGLQEYPNEYEMQTPGNDFVVGSVNNDFEDKLPNSKYELKIKGILPLVMHSINGTDRSLMILPFFIWMWSVACRESKFISILYFHSIKGESTRRWLLPIFYQRRIQDDYKIISLLFFRIKSGSKQFTLLFPLYIDIIKGESHIMILLFPTFIHYRKSIFKFTTLFPFYFMTQDASKGDFFVYYFPIFGNSSSGSKSKNYYFLFPLFGYKRNDETEAVVIDVFFPIFHYEKSKDSKSVRFLPIFWKSKNAYHEFLLIMPFYWKFVTNKDSRPQRNTLIFPFYFKRDSAEYMFTFASPLFLPPYYVHYHREASQVEQTYFFPFYAHKIKGLDHLRWVLLVLYRHTWKDFSEYFNYNILLYFKHNGASFETSGFIPLFVQWFDKKNQKYHLRVLLLLSIDKMKTEAIHKYKLCMFYLFWNRFSLFHHAYQSKPVNEDSKEKLIRRKDYLFPFFHYKSDDKDNYSHFSLLWVGRPLIAFLHTSSDKDTSYTHIFLAFYRKVDSMSSQIAILWFFHPIVSMFLRESTVFSTITRLFPIFYNLQAAPSSSTMNENSLSDRKVSGTHLFSLLYIYPGFAFFNYKSKQNKLSHYILFFYNYRRDSTDRSFGLLWLVRNYISFFYYSKTIDTTMTRIFPIYYYINQPGTLFNLSILWIGLPQISMIRYYKSNTSKVVSCFPIFWVKKQFDASETLEVAILYVVRRFGFISYLSTNDEYRFFILFIIWVQRCQQKFYLSILFLISPKATFFRIISGPIKFKSFIFLFYYYKSNETQDETTFSLLWFFHPKVSFVSYFRRQEVFRFYILLLFWLSGIENYYQFGLFWLFPKKYYVDRNNFVGTNVGSIYIPVSMILWLNDGETTVVHVLPIFRYVNESRDEKEMFWTLFGAVYFSSHNGNPDFRFFYRLIRVKSKPSFFLFEFNPFFSYKNDGNKSKLLFIGGCSGCYTEYSRTTARVCCIECC